MKTTLLLAAVGNSGQCAYARSGNLVQVTKVKVTVKLICAFKVLIQVQVEAMANTCASSRGNT